MIEKMKRSKKGIILEEEEWKLEGLDESEWIEGERVDFDE